MASIKKLDAIGTGEGDVLPRVRPGDLVALVLHVLNETLPVNSVLQPRL